MLDECQDSEQKIKILNNYIYVKSTFIPSSLLAAYDTWNVSSLGPRVLTNGVGLCGYAYA